MKKLTSGGVVVLAISAIAILSACVQLGASETEKTLPMLPVNDGSSEFVSCTNPRPEICYEIYQPVCATRDTGIRCVTTPCPSTEYVTYSNDCQACADPSVHGFLHGGVCPEGSVSG